MNKQEVILNKLNGTLEQYKNKEINKRIRLVYTIDDELAIHRQRDTKPTQFEDYNNTIEEIKANVKEEINELLR